MPVAGSDAQKRTNEIGMAISLLEGCDIAGKDITGDALLTQRKLATYVVERQAHYHFTVKSNQPALERDIALLFETRGAPDFVEVTPPDHGRIETRSIWCGTALNAYLAFPHVGQVFLIERESIEKRPARTAVRSHWGSRAAHHKRHRPNACWPSTEAIGALKAFDWNYDEDRSQIRTGFGPENITRLRRFAVGILKSFQKSAQSIPEMMRKLTFKTRLVFHYLRLTQNSSATGFAH